MDYYILIVVFVIFFIVFSVCGYCCKRNKQGVVYGANPAMVTTTTSYNTSNVPYPVMEAPMPQPMQVPPTGYAPHAAYPPTTPYPPAQGGYPPAHQTPYPPAPGEFSSQAPHGYYPMPMPMQGGYQGNTPYPSMPMPGGAFTAPVPPYPPQQSTNYQPPSYAEAVTRPVQTEGYAKQSAYNPSYQ